MISESVHCFHLIKNKLHFTKISFSFLLPNWYLPVEVQFLCFPYQMVVQLSWTVVLRWFWSVFNLSMWCWIVLLFSYFSPLLKSISRRADVDYAMIEEDLEEREDFISSLESRFLFLAADARSTLRLLNYLANDWQFYFSCFSLGFD